jgi:uncharacterized protein
MINSYGQILKAGEDGSIEGYAVRYNVADREGDTFQPGCFADSLKMHKAMDTMPAMLWHHGKTTQFGNVPIGVYNDLAEDDKGLRVKGLVDLSMERVREVHGIAVKGKGIYLSVGALPMAPSKRSGSITKADVFEISLTPTPIVPGTRVLARAIDEVERLADVEEILRDAGFSRQQSVALIARVKALSQSESDRASHGEHGDALEQLRNLVTNRKLF